MENFNNGGPPSQNTRKQTKARQQEAAFTSLANIELDLMGNNLVLDEDDPQYIPLSPTQSGRFFDESSLFNEPFELDIEDMRKVAAPSPGISDASKAQHSTDPSRELEDLQGIAKGLERSIEDHKLAIEKRLREQPDQEVQQQLTDILQSLAKAKEQRQEQEDAYRNYNQLLSELDARVFDIRNRLHE